MTPPAVDPLALPTIHARSATSRHRGSSSGSSTRPSTSTGRPAPRTSTAIGVPAFVVAGWADSFPASTNFPLVATILGAELVLGPWGPTPVGLPRSVPGRARSRGRPRRRRTRALIRFFDPVLAGRGEPSPAPVRCFTGGRGWQDADEWPAADRVGAPALDRDERHGLGQRPTRRRATGAG